MQVPEIELQYRTDDGQHRKVVFVPEPEHGGWTRRELHRDAADEPWTTVGVESVTDLAVSCSSVEVPGSIAGP